MAYFEDDPLSTTLHNRKAQCFTDELAALDTIVGLHLEDGPDDGQENLVVVTKVPRATKEAKDAQRLRTLEVLGTISLWLLSWVLLGLIGLGLWKVVEFLRR